MSNLDEPINLAGDDDAIELDGGPEGEASSGAEIKMFGAKVRHEDKWDRKPNVTNTGAIHWRR